MINRSLSEVVCHQSQSVTIVEFEIAICVDLGAAGLVPAAASIRRAVSKRKSMLDQFGIEYRASFTQNFDGRPVHASSQERQAADFPVEREERTCSGENRTA